MVWAFIFKKKNSLFIFLEKFIAWAICGCYHYYDRADSDRNKPCADAKAGFRHICAGTEWDPANGRDAARKTVSTGGLLAATASAFPQPP